MADSVTWRNILSVADFRKISNVRSLISIALQSQYSHSERYRQLGLLFNAEIDASPQLDAFFNNILNPETAVGVWLEWWGKRVGVTRNLLIDGVDTRLDDEFFRFLIFYRAVVNVSNGTAETINRLLTKLIGLPVFVSDYQNMSIRIRIVGEPTSVQIAILKNYGLLNRPAGVLANIESVVPNELVFGFFGSNLLPFNQGVFNPSKNIEI
ncbi:DUF2612 domain-containing protein [uncultured Parasutterella sp.]|uniref:DUF2612 domain-containing protein n=1 Tax=uncultured Parasutterella sp. TaxID=1263098 RepID=UPI0025B67911|nr:DUF2612 domain-containing protein [uncultured Parasutterella sp.]